MRENARKMRRMGASAAPPVEKPKDRTATGSLDDDDDDLTLKP